MPCRIEDYALIGDCQGAALVGRDGSIDWLCLPRFDSDACFAALLGTEENGFWKIAPCAEVVRTTRHYREGTLTLETEMETAGGSIRIIDFMPIDDPRPDLVRIVVGTSGSVKIRSELAIRCGYGRTVPWVQSAPGGVQAIAGPDRFRFATPIPTFGENFRTVAEVVVKEGDRLPFVLAWSPSHEPLADIVDPERALARTNELWRAWSSRCRDVPPYDAIVRRSLITLKALTFAPTGGMVAAPTSSLPELLGGVRNWDYRYCWVRDATFTLTSLVSCGYTDEARAWEKWLLRACAGAPAQMQILYGIGGERRLTEVELDWLDGYEASRPVRVGNKASEQAQLDVYGELMDAIYVGQRAGLHPSDEGWSLRRALLRHLAEGWRKPDHGIWEVRGQARHFTHSKVMCWVAFDRAIKTIETCGLEGPVDEWRAIRDAIFTEVCSRGYDPARNTFVQHYETTETDASLLLIPIVGFLPATDPRVAGTVDAILSELSDGTFVQRYRTHRAIDGLPTGEGTFLPCSFWLADALVLLGRQAEARALFDRLLLLANDVGLFAEEYEPRARRMLGNFPQALSHVALVNTALNLAKAAEPARRRGAT